MLALLAVFNAALVTAVDVTRFPTVEEATAPAADETVARPRSRPMCYVN